VCLRTFVRLVLKDVAKNATVGGGGLKLDAPTVQKLQLLLDKYIDECVRQDFGSENRGIRMFHSVYKLLPIPRVEGRVDQLMQILARDIKTSDP